MLNMLDSQALGVSQDQVLRCIHVGLLCVQANATLHPDMSNVIVMLSSSSMTLMYPSKLAFVSTSEIQGSKPQSKSSWGNDEHKNRTISQSLVYEASLNEVEAR